MIDMHLRSKQNEVSISPILIFEKGLQESDEKVKASITNLYENKIKMISVIMYNQEEKGSKRRNANIRAFQKFSRINFE